MKKTSPYSNFDVTLQSRGCRPLRRGNPATVQLNLGKLCNQACHHCHVGAGPKRTEIMSRHNARRILELLEHSTAVSAVDITGGAPEMCPSFRELVPAIRTLERRVLVRCNLTIIYESGMQWLPDFYRKNNVELICSLPCYTAENVDAQRGSGVFEKSIDALRLLNSLGYGNEPGLALDLVYNPGGATLPPPQG